MTNPHLILPAGTQVVLRVAAATGAGAVLAGAGAVGVVVDVPADHTHAYRVRLPDGAEAMLRRHELSIRKHDQALGIAAPGEVLREYDLYGHVVLRCVVGSRAYGLETEDSDTDVRGVYLPPAHLHWGLHGVPEQLESRETEECYWELQKFLTLALKANPNVLECLYTPLTEARSPLAAELLAERGRFLSRVVYQTFNGYVMSQFRRMEQDVRTAGTPKWKHAMHLIRLLLSGVTALRDGHIPVRVEEHRHRLLAIRAGDTSWAELNDWRLGLHREFDAAFAATRLPPRPDYAWANDFLVRARRHAAAD